MLSKTSLLEPFLQFKPFRGLMQKFAHSLHKRCRKRLYFKTSIIKVLLFIQAKLKQATPVAFLTYFDCLKYLQKKKSSNYNLKLVETFCTTYVSAKENFQ